MNDTLKRYVLRRAKLVCHNRLRWEKLRYTIVRYYPLKVHILRVRIITSLVMHSARGKHRLIC